ncbi:MAG TPA: hypothetical protein VLX91_10310 [Candidatus Acidoferrales bacterium]|nr:hypothetical protein [Candidatus Acidoferrales bacterium]
MKEKSDGKLTIQVATAIPKTLHSRDSADRLVRTAVSFWRARPDRSKKDLTALVLDFNGIAQLSESAASALVEFRLEFSGDNDPAIEFSNMTNSVKKTFAGAEKSLRRFQKRINGRGKKKSSFIIEV